MSKKDLRTRISGLRNTLSEKEITLFTEEILDKVVKSPEYINATEVFVYVNYKQEVPTLPLIRHALEKGKKVAVPRVEGEGSTFTTSGKSRTSSPAIWEYGSRSSRMLPNRQTLL